MHNTRIVVGSQNKVDIYDKRQVLDFIKGNQFLSSKEIGIKISFRANLILYSSTLKEEQGDIEIRCNSHLFAGHWTLKGAGLLHVKGISKSKVNTPTNKAKEFAGWLNLQENGILEGYVYGLPVDAYRVEFKVNEYRNTDQEVEL